MSVKVAKNRFIDFSLKGLYRYLTYHFSNFQALGERIIHEAETAQAFRQTEKLEELGLILSNFPIKEYQLAGQYYIGWCLNRKGKNTQGLFEKLIEESATYRPMALIELASSQARKANYDSSVTYYTEALKYSRTPYTVVLAERSIAAARGIEGDHTRAIKTLERISPLVRYCHPVERYQYLNSLAVELVEVGRLEEAQNVCRITLASPFINAYPEWRETWQELALRGYKSRSVVSVPKLPLKSNNVVPMPANTNPSLPQKRGGKVLDLQAWIEKMVKEQNGDDKIKNVDNMSEQDMVLELIGMLTGGEADEEQIRKLLKAALKIFSEK